MKSFFNIIFLILGAIMLGYYTHYMVPVVIWVMMSSYNSLKND